MLALQPLHFFVQFGIFFADLYKRSDWILDGLQKLISYIADSISRKVADTRFC
jgi:hypothetical protein